MAKVGYGYRKGWNPILGDVELKSPKGSQYINLKTDDCKTIIPIYFTEKNGKKCIDESATEKRVKNTLHRLIKNKTSWGP